MSEKGRLDGIQDDFRNDEHGSPPVSPPRCKPGISEPRRRLVFALENHGRREGPRRRGAADCSPHFAGF